MKPLQKPWRPAMCFASRKFATEDAEDTEPDLPTASAFEFANGHFEDLALCPLRPRWPLFVTESPS